MCEHCLAGKATRLPFGKAKRASSPLQIIHSDICGPINVRARHGGNYFITFIDDFTLIGHVYLISHKSKVWVSIFGSVRFLSKTVNKPKITVFFKKNQNRTEPVKNRPFSVRFDSNFYD